MTDRLRIAFIGAGCVNFGGGEGPWDHASRLERIEGIRVVAVCDPDTERAESVLRQRTSPVFAAARVYADHRKMIASEKPDAVWIGVPPAVHGTVEPGLDIERFCAGAGVHMFIEKPLSSARPEAVAPVAAALAQSDVCVSVGYMFRYSRALDAARRILGGTPGGVKAFLARYDCAYSDIRKREWWDSRSSGGPIVEQATHVVDLARFLCGEAVAGSIRAVQIAGDEPAADMLDAPRATDGRRYDGGIPPEYQVPRATAAVWKFESGAVGSLVHGAWLHGRKYESEIEIWGDGLRLVLQDPYGACRLLVRRPGCETSEVMSFEGDDPYLTEDRAFVDALRSGDAAGILSPYADAFRTFRLTWQIADAARG